MFGMKTISSKILTFKKGGGFLFLLFFGFASFIMWKTFRVKNGYLLISSHIYSDFAAIIPLIRSFSHGLNFPPEYPIFAGYPIRYHFIFYALVGFFEKIGIRIDLALNTLSAISFALLLYSIYKLSLSFFHKKSVSLLCIILFLFNGSMGFLEFFKENPISLNIFQNILKNTKFSSFGPYDGKIVSAFWNLNIYTNQRHLALAYALFILLTLHFYKKINSPRIKKIEALAIGTLVGIFPFLHLAVFLMIFLALVSYFFLFPEIRRYTLLIILLALFLALPQFYFMGKSKIYFDLINFGYLSQDKTLFGMIKYWFYNLGLYLVTIPVGYSISSPKIKKILFPFILFFVIGNIFQLSPEIAANHKFFNLFAIAGNIITSFLIIEIGKKLKKATILLIIPFILTGVIDFFPIINDYYVEIEDIAKDKSIQFILEKTPRNSLFLNSNYLYNKASLAGRKIFMGWPYFAWSAGYNTNEREKIMKKIFSSESKEEICKLVLENKINYISIQRFGREDDFPAPNVDFFDKNFSKIYQTPTSDFFIIDVASNCQGTQMLE